MLKKFFAVRFITSLIVIVTMVNAFAFVGIGAYLSAEGIILIFYGGVHTEVHPGLMILGSLDAFLVALVFLIFAIGIVKLFHPKFDEDYSDVLPPWLDLHSFTDLKLILWEAILTTMVVLFVSDVVRRNGEFDWTMLILPGSIFLLSTSVLILKKSEEKKAPADVSE